MLIKAYGGVPPKWVPFHQKSLNMGPILVKKSLEEGPISQQVCKPLEMGLDLRKFQQQQKNISKLSRFWGRKILSIHVWVRVSDLRQHTPSQNNLSTHSPGHTSGHPNSRSFWWGLDWKICLQLFTFSVWKCIQIFSGGGGGGGGHSRTRVVHMRNQKNSKKGGFLHLLCCIMQLGWGW